MPQNVKPGLHLIIMGNKKVDTFANTLRGVANHWKDSIFEEVHLIRIGSYEEMPDWRKLCYTLFPGLLEYHEVYNTPQN